MADHTLSNGEKWEINKSKLHEVSYEIIDPREITSMGRAIEVFWTNANKQMQFFSSVRVLTLTVQICLAWICAT